MEYSNFYDLKSLVRLNEREGCACSIEERDVEKVNQLISRMRKEREENRYRLAETPSLIPPVAATTIRRRTLKEAMTGKGNPALPSSPDAVLP